jgi:hypothetical protein
MKSTGKLFPLAIIAACLIISAALVVRRAAPAGGSAKDYLVKAFRNDPVIKNELRKYERGGYMDEGTTTVTVDGTCGIAGCDFATLVVRVYKSKGVNPQTRSVMGVVHWNAEKGITGVVRVELVPVDK